MYDERRADVLVIDDTPARIDPYPEGFVVTTTENGPHETIITVTNPKLFCTAGEEEKYEENDEKQIV